MAGSSGGRHWIRWPWWVRALAVAAGAVVLTGVVLLVLPAPRWVQVAAAGLGTVGLVVVLSYTPKKWFSGWPWWARALAIAAGGVVLAGLVLAVWKLPPLLYSDPGLLPRDRANAESSTRTGLIAGLAGLAALGSLLVTSRTYRLTEQGHITDRYTKAIEQLGDEKLDIRLGGIDALERLAIDSARDHPTVVEVLSAFVRERSAAARARTRPIGRKTAHPPSLRVKRAELPSTDVRAALTVLGRLPVREGVSRGTLNGANLTGAVLSKATLTSAFLYQADLTGANLNGANLTSANLNLADLTGAYLIEADLTSASLASANLTGARLNGANLTGASLLMAYLTGAFLTRATLTADLRGAHLTGAYLAGATLTGALRGADLTDANLAGADLTGARGLTDDQFAAARGDEETKLPETVTRPESWTT